MPTSRNPQRNVPVLPGLTVPLLMQGTDGGNTIRVFLLIYLAAGQNLVLNQESFCREEKVLLYQSEQGTCSEETLCYPCNDLAIELHTGTSVSFISFTQNGSFALKDKELCYHVVYFILFPFHSSQRRLEVLFDTCQKRAHLLQHRLFVSPLRPSRIACIIRELKHSNWCRQDEKSLILILAEWVFVHSCLQANRIWGLLYLGESRMWEATSISHTYPVCWLTKATHPACPVSPMPDNKLFRILF